MEEKREANKLHLLVVWGHAQKINYNYENNNIGQSTNMFLYFFRYLNYMCFVSGQAQQVYKLRNTAQKFACFPWSKKYKINALALFKRVHSLFNRRKRATDWHTKNNQKIAAIGVAMTVTVVVVVVDVGLIHLIFLKGHSMALLVYFLFMDTEKRLESCNCK